MNPDYHAANRKHWEARRKQWSEDTERRGLWRQCVESPELVLTPLELRHLSELQGKRAAVLGSGDGEIALALAGLGAAVTAVDIAQGQLDELAQRVAELALPVDTLRADVTSMSELGDGEFDVAYTGGHVAIWVSSIDEFYREAARILRPGGLFIVTEYHPFRRIWKESPDALEVERPYFHRGPYEYKNAGESTYEFQWTLTDYINAVLKAGCSILQSDEFGQGGDSWETAPVEKLPKYLTIVARKDGAEE